MPPPAPRRLLRAGAGASPGLHGLAPGSSALRSAKATPGKGAPPPPPRSPSQATSTGSSGPKRPRPRCPRGPWSSCPSLLLPRSCSPTPWPRSGQSPSLGAGTAWGGSWTTVATLSGKGAGSERVDGLGSPGEERPEGARPRLLGRGPGWRLVTGSRARRVGGPRGPGERGAAPRRGARVLGRGASAAGAAGRGRAGAGGGPRARPESAAREPRAGQWGAEAGRRAALIGWRALLRRARPPLHVCAGAASWRQRGRTMRSGRSRAGPRPRRALPPACTP